MDHEMYEELVRGILSVLSGQVIRIVLYGSAARGTNTPESDVDIAVFLNSTLGKETEDRLSDIVVDMNLIVNELNICTKQLSNRYGLRSKAYETTQRFELFVWL